MKCSICKSGTHLTASCASTCMKFLFSSLQCSHSTVEYFRCKVFIFASHSYIYKSESAESTAVQQIFNREIRSIFFLKEERDRESVWALLKVERKSGVRRGKKESSESERHMGSSAHHCNSHNTQLSHAQAANVSLLLKKGVVCLYSHPAISICDRPRLALFLCAKHFARDNSRQHTSCLDGKLGKYNADCVASTVTLLVGNISFKCECPPVCLLFNGAETEAER